MRSTHAYRVLALLLGIGCASSTPRHNTTPHAPRPPASASSSEPEAIDPEAGNFAYPYPVKFFALDSQGQPLRMAYIDVAAEKPNGRSVVLFHGKNFSAAAWASTIAALASSGFRVIAADQIGFGKSSKPVGYQYSFALLASHTRALLASLGIERSAVVGHSMGGMLAVRYALSYPNSVERLVLVNPIGLEDYAALVPYRSIDDWYKDELKQTPASVRDYQRTAYYDGAWTPAYEALATLQMGWTKHRNYARIAWTSALLYDMIFTQPVVHDLPRLSVPTCLIIGTRDKTALGRNFAPPEVASTMGDYTQLGKKARDVIPGAELVELDGLGHVPQVEAFDRFREALLHCLAQP